MQKISTFLWFDHQAEEAAKFYVSLFDNSKITGTMPGGPGGKPMGVNFTLDGVEYMALNGGPAFKLTEAVSLFVRCTSQREVDTLWEKLISGGGSPSQCGWLKDRYGLSWQIIPDRLMELLGDKDPGRRQRATEAMLKMQKIDVAALEAAVAKKG